MGDGEEEDEEEEEGERGRGASCVSLPLARLLRRLHFHK